MPTNPNRLEEDVLRIVERHGAMEATEILRECEDAGVPSSAVMFAIQRALDAGKLRLTRTMQIAAAPKRVEAA